MSNSTQNLKSTVKQLKKWGLPNLAKTISTQKDYKYVYPGVGRDTFASKLVDDIKDGVQDTQNDHIVDVNKKIRNNWEKRFDDMFQIVNIGRDIMFNEINGKDKIKSFIAKELADARKEVIEKAIEKIMECRKEIARYQCNADILNKCVTKHEKAWINSGFRLSLESTNKLLAHFLATLKEEGK